MLRAYLFTPIAAPLLAGCFSSAPDHHPWTQTFSDLNGASSTVVAVSPSGEVAMAGSFSGELDIGGAKLVGTAMEDNDVYMALLDYSGRPVWAGGTGSIGDQRAYGVAFAPDGSMLVTGGFTNTVSFGTGTLTAVSNDIFLVDLAHDGKTVWAEQFGADLGGPQGIGSGTPSGVAVDASGNVAIGGGFTGSIGFGGAPLDANPQAQQTSFVAKVDVAGKHVYSLAFDGVANTVNAVAFDPAGNLLVAGYNQDDMTIGSTTLFSGVGAGFLAKLDPSGKALWAFLLGGTGITQSLAVATDGGGNILLGGSFTDTLVAGDLSAKASTQSDGFVLGVTPDGTPLWLKVLGGTTIRTVAFGASGTVLVSGSYQGMPDFGGGALPQQFPAGGFATRLDGKGTYLSTLAFGEPEGASVVAGIGQAGADAVLGGTFTGQIVIENAGYSAAGGGDLFAVRLSL